MARITPDVPQRGASQNLLRVIDNYYRPARDVMGEQAMVQGFNSMSNFFGNEAAKAKKEQLQDIATKAQADAMAGLDPDEELSQVRKGLLFRSNSRAYNMAYNETMGRKAAIEFKDNATLEYEKSGLKNSTDPNKFREWMNGKVHSFLTDPAHSNPYFLAGAMNYVEQATFNMSAAHMSNIQRKMEANQLAAIQKQADDIALRWDSGEITKEQALGMLTGLNSQAYGTGISGPKSRKALLSSILSVADATDNKEMLEAILEARAKGDLRLTPAEWNTITKEVQGIERDISFREAQQERVQKAQKEAEELTVTDFIADFYNNPANAGVPFSALLQQPNQDGVSMADAINNSANSATLLKKAKETYETVNSIYEIPKSQELQNNLAISTAVEEGIIKDSGTLMSFMQGLQSDGGRFNDANWTHAYSELEKANDPEQAYGTQTYKDYKPATVNRIIGALTPEISDTFPFEEKYGGTQAEDIKMRFQGYLDEGLAALPVNQRKDPALIRKAIELAEKATMDFYKENDPDLFNKQFNSFTKAVDGGEVSWTSNPYFAQEAARLAAEQQQAIANEQTAMQNNRTAGFAKDKANSPTLGDRVDLEIQAGLDVLLGNNDAVQQDQTTVITPQQQEALNQVSQAEARQAEDAQRRVDEQAAADALAERQRQVKEALRAGVVKSLSGTLGVINEMGQTIGKASAGKDNKSLEAELDIMLKDMQERYNLTVPTNYEELNFLVQDISAAMEESGVTLDQAILQMLIEAGIRQFSRK